MKTAQMGTAASAILLVATLIGSAAMAPAQVLSPGLGLETAPARKVVEESPGAAPGSPGFGSALDPTLYPGVVGAPSLEAAGSCCHLCGEGCCTPPLWTVDVNARILGRDRCGGVVLATATNASGTTYGVITGKTVNLDIAPGLDASLMQFYGRDSKNHDWFGEVRYQGLNQWSSTATVATPAYAVSSGRVSGTSVVHGTLNSCLDTNTYRGLNWSDQMDYRYESEINSLEYNLIIRPRSGRDRLVLYPSGCWQRECQPGDFLSFLIGLRYFNLDESCRLDGAGTYHIYNASGVLIDNIPHSGRYFIHTSNNMLGIQFGGDLTFRRCWWNWGLHTKLSPMVNVARQSSSVNTDDAYYGTQEVHWQDSKNDIAVLINLGVIGEYKLQPNIAVRAGYEVNWLAGAALAPNQANSVTVHNDATLFFHGLTLGFEVTR